MPRHGNDKKYGQTKNEKDLKVCVQSNERTKDRYLDGEVVGSPLELKPMYHPPFEMIHPVFCPVLCVSFLS